MRIILSKKQIDLLREGLDVAVDSDGNPNDLGQEVTAALNKSGVDKVTFDSEALTSTEPKPTLQVPLPNGKNATQAIQKTLNNDPKLLNALQDKDADIEVIKKENVVRYSVKELNEILFR